MVDIEHPQLQAGRNWVASGKRFHITNWNITDITMLFMGNITISTRPFSSSQTVTNYQRVTGQLGKWVVQMEENMEDIFYHFRKWWLWETMEKGRSGTLHGEPSGTPRFEIKTTTHNCNWLVVWNMAFIFHFIYGMSSFPGTNSYVSRWDG